MTRVLPRVHEPRRRRRRAVRARRKNVIAVAAGMSDGLGYGDNTKATLMTRGLAEMSRLGRAHGREPAHVHGPRRHGRPHRHVHLAHSRNRSLGEFVGKGGTLRGLARLDGTWSPRARSRASRSTSSASARASSCRSRTQVRAILYEGEPVAEARGRAPRPRGARRAARDGTRRGLRRRARMRGRVF